jgi:hypothetical protein
MLPGSDRIVKDYFKWLVVGAEWFFPQLSTGFPQLIDKIPTGLVWSV